MAHGELPAPTGDRRLLLVFVSPVAAELAHFASHLGYAVTALDPDPARQLTGCTTVTTVAEAGPDTGTDVVVTDHDRPELGDVLAEALAAPSRWVGVMGSLRHTAPHVAALAERGVRAGRRRARPPADRPRHRVPLAGRDRGRDPRRAAGRPQRPSRVAPSADR
jgi:xanthine/CO dehydrogenase XdhC/CoxF family maturation factor